MPIENPEAFRAHVNSEAIKREVIAPDGMIYRNAAVVRRDCSDEERQRAEKLLDQWETEVRASWKTEP